MKVQGHHDLPFSRTDVWKALMDPALLSRTLPGCDELTPAGENTWNGKMRVQVGPVRGVFKGKLTLSDLVEEQSYVMHLDGQGPTGFMDGGGSLRLEDAGDACTLHYDLEFQVGGRIAGVGQRVLESSARAVTRQGLEGLEREMTALAAPVTPAAKEPAAAPSAAAASPPPSSARTASSSYEPAPSQAEMAVRIAREVAADLVPPECRGWLAAGFLFFIGLAIGRFWRGDR